MWWSRNPGHQSGSPTGTRQHPPRGRLSPTPGATHTHRRGCSHPPRTGWGRWEVAPSGCRLPEARGAQRARGAAARSTPGPSPAERAAGGSVSPGFIGIIIIIIIFIIILVEFPDAGSSGEPAITEAALGFLFTYLFYSGGALPDFSKQPWPGGRGGEEAAPVGHFSDMLSRSPPPVSHPSLPHTKWGARVRDPQPPGPEPTGRAGQGIPNPLQSGCGLRCHGDLVPCGGTLLGSWHGPPPHSPVAPMGRVWGASSWVGGSNPVQTPWAGTRGEKRQEEEQGARISPVAWRMPYARMNQLQTSAAHPGGPHVGWARQPRPSLQSSLPPHCLQ